MVGLILIHQLDAGSRAMKSDQEQRDIRQQRKADYQMHAMKCFWRRLNRNRKYKITLTEAMMIWCVSGMAREFEINFKKGEW